MAVSWKYRDAVCQFMLTRHKVQHSHILERAHLLVELLIVVALIRIEIPVCLRNVVRRRSERGHKCTVATLGQVPADVVAVAVGDHYMVDLLRRHASAAAKIAFLRRFDTRKIGQQCTVGRAVVVRTGTHACVDEYVVANAV